MNISVKVTQEESLINTFDLELGTLISDEGIVEVVMDTVTSVREELIPYADKPVVLNIKSDIIELNLKCSSLYAATVFERIKFNLMCRAEYELTDLERVNDGAGKIFLQFHPEYEDLCS